MSVGRGHGGPAGRRAADMHVVADERHGGAVARPEGASKDGREKKRGEGGRARRPRHACWPRCRCSSHGSGLRAAQRRPHSSNAHTAMAAADTNLWGTPSRLLASRRLTVVTLLWLTPTLIALARRARATVPTNLNECRNASEGRSISRSLARRSRCCCCLSFPPACFPVQALVACNMHCHSRGIRSLIPPRHRETRKRGETMDHPPHPTTPARRRCAAGTHCDSGARAHWAVGRASSSRRMMG